MPQDWQAWVGAAQGNWDDKLAAFLAEAHDDDGALKAGSVTRDRLAADVAASVPETPLGVGEMVVGTADGAIVVPAADFIGDVMADPPALLLSPDGSVTDAGTVSPVVAATVSTVAGQYGDAWLLTKGTTNLHNNPSAETDLTGYQASAPLVLTRDTTASTYGGASVKVTAASGATAKRVLLLSTLSPSLTGVTSLVGGVDVWGANNERVEIDISGTYSDASTFQGTRSARYTLGPTPARYDIPAVTIDPAKTVTQVRTSIWMVDDTVTVNADGWQIEQGTVSTPFVAGTRPDGTVTLSGLTADISGDGEPVPGPSFDPARTVNFPSDLHFGTAGSALRMPLAVTDLIALNDQIALRVIPGDLTDTPGNSTQQDDAEAWLLSLDTRDRWEVIAGNHDIGGIYDGDWFAATWGQASRYWTRDIGDDYRLIGITGRNQSGTPPMLLFDEDLAYLESALEATTRQCVIVFHAPLKGTVTFGAYSSENPIFYAAPDVEIRAILDAHDNAFMWVSGHTHTSTQDPNIFMLKNVGSRDILHLNCSSLYFVPGDPIAGPGGYGPLQSPVVTFDPDHVTVRWRDHEHETWKLVNGSTSLSLPAYPEANGNILIRYSEGGVAGTAVLNGPGTFGSYGVVAYSSGTLTLSTTAQTTVESVVAFPSMLPRSRWGRIRDAARQWTYSNVHGVGLWT